MTVSINNTDITPFIQESSYEMNRYTDHKEWIDGNRRKHREIMRNYIKGSFEMVFVTESDLSDFMDLVEDNTVNGILTITLYIQNINQTDEYEVFCEIVGNTDRKINNDYFFKKFNVSITEV